ncbi:Thioesterase thiol ester dehydrase-isomerase [Fusarium albosuccineum]|uniref:Thioesterase thiol ester dehydrase-isomerase n=1 Tax=Fusarium albosuccineum TaxID=1237068 RepID=A0A8H4P8K4_9HYPO|nr:Thioesterase thiol ester dehydrase-isomerase [Fusarium albosuccineum]
MKLLVFASIIALGMALPPPTPVILEVIDMPDSGCKPYQAPGCCVPTLCHCKDGKMYLFNDADKASGGSGCNPPWGYMGESVGQIPGYCC